MAEACRALDFPVISGNVSLYNETDGRAILPTPAIGGVGILDNLELRADAGAMKAGQHVVVVGFTASLGHLGQSLYLREVLGREEGAPPPVDLAQEKRVGDFVRGLIAAGEVTACHDVSDGGLGCALAEMALASGIGVSLYYQGEGSDAEFLFGEDQGRYVIAFDAAFTDAFDARAEAAGVNYLLCGEAGGSDIAYLGVTGAKERIPLEDLRRLHEAWLPAYMKLAH